MPTQFIPNLFQEEYADTSKWERIRKFQRLSANIYQDIQMGSTLYTISEDHAYPDLPIPLHSHDFYELSYCKSCQDAYYLMNGKQYRLSKGDIILVPPGSVHRPVLNGESKTAFVRILLLINRESIQTMLRLFSQEENQEPLCAVLSTKDTSWDFLGNLFESMLRENNLRRPSYRGVVFGNVITLLSYFLRASTEKGVQPESSALLDYLLNYIEHHIRDELSLGKLADFFHVSESALVKLFKSRLGISPHSYIIQRRLAQAKNLIREGQSLNQLYLEVGYRDYTAFFRAFKKEYGISPNQFREMLGR